MTAKFFAILTNQGAAKLANAASLGTKLNLSQIAVGDANGTLPTPDPAQTKLINQKRIAPLNRLSVDPNNANQIIAEQVIPENEGGYWIREIGLYDDENVLIAIANCPETYKPQLQEGSGRTQTIRMVVVVSSTAAVTLKIDPSVVLATRQYADDKEVVVKAYVDDLLAAHFAAENPHPQYLKIVDINSYFPLGVPIPYPAAIPPHGWFNCNGSAFDKEKYPLLASLFPSGNLPDLRGEFIRGWDNGRNVDAARVLGEWQGDALQQHTHDYFTILPTIDTDRGGNSSLFSLDNSTWSTTNGVGGGARVASETRPRNIAFNYIMRAA